MISYIILSIPCQDINIFVEEKGEEMWLYKNKEFPEKMAEEYWGFVYLITNLINNKKYVGKKQFRFKKSLPPLKGKKRKRIKWVDSDWKEYWGSNDELKEDVKKYGEENFKREILHLCKNKTECSYFEAKEQFERDVLLKEDYYNNWIMVRVRKRKGLLKNG